MEDKAVSVRGFNPTGTGLLLLLGAGLNGSILWLDLQQGKSIATSLLIPFLLSTIVVAAIGYLAIYSGRWSPSTFKKSWHPNDGWRICCPDRDNYRHHLVAI